MIFSVGGTNPQGYRPAGVQACRGTGSPGHRLAGVQACRGTSLPGNRLARAQACRGTGPQGYRPAGVQACRGTDLPGYRPAGAQACRGTNPQGYVRTEDDEAGGMPQKTGGLQILYGETAKTTLCLPGLQRAYCPPLRANARKRAREPRKVSAAPFLFVSFVLAPHAAAQRPFSRQSTITAVAVPMPPGSSGGISSNAWPMITQYPLSFCLPVQDITGAGSPPAT